MAPDTPLPPAANRAAALRAIASPARQELLSEMGHGRASARELAARLGRSRQALHHHLAALVKAGLVHVVEERGSGREAERIYAIVPGSLNLARDRMSPRELALAARATRAMLRLTERELDGAIKRGELTSGTGKPLALALRAKARLNEAGRTRLQELIREITDLFRAAKGANPDERLVAITLVMSPARDSSKKTAAKPGVAHDAF